MTTTEPTGGLVSRVIAFVEEETEGLRHASDFDVHASSLRKHRLLLDLHHGGSAPVPPPQLQRLKTALEENRIELAARLEVAQRIADIAVGVVREDRRDGTYGTRLPR